MQSDMMMHSPSLKLLKRNSILVLKISENIKMLHAIIKKNNSLITSKIFIKKLYKNERKHVRFKISSIHLHAFFNFN